MKICWDNLERCRLSREGNLKIGTIVYVEMDRCETCGDPYLTIRCKQSNFCGHSCSLSGKNHPQYGKKFPKVTREKMSLSAKKRFADNRNNPNYKGGVEKLGLPLFDTFAPQLDYVEEVKLILKDEFKLLGVKCTYCNKWFIPTLIAVRGRLAALKQDPGGRTYGESRFYCSGNCKQSCPIFGMRDHPKDFKKGTSREVSTYLRQMVFERDNWECQKCGKTEKEAPLHCHHIKGYTQNKILANDIDNCITFCKECHEEVHKRYGCRYVDLQCKEGK